VSESEHLSVCTIHLSVIYYLQYLYQISSFLLCCVELCSTALSSLSFANPYCIYCRLSEAPMTHPTPVRDDDDDDDDGNDR
jgi:hypothetical protein